MSRVIEVHWKTPDALNYLDILPVEEFATETDGREGAHVVLGPGGKEYSARYLLSVKGDTATLDYGHFPKVNTEAGMHLGRMQFTFPHKSRRGIPRVSWNERPVSDAEATAKYATASSLSERVVKRQRETATRLARPGQAQFRGRLDRAYGFRCCLTGCNVPVALKAAHIVDVRDGGPDSTTNGILLRSDLHDLFDNHQLGIDPKTRSVRLSEAALASPDYQGLDGKPLANPQPMKDAPADKFLGIRWKKFNEALEKA